jgi:DNA topoisomerase-1
MAFEFFNKLFDFTAKPTFKNGGIAIVEATPEQIEERWEKKKEAIETLANNIRKLRMNITKDMASDDEKTALTALVIAVMMKSGERVGNEDSAASIDEEGDEKDPHYGVTGFRKKHIDIEDNTVLLEYVGKSAKEHRKSFTDANIAAALKKAIKNSPDYFVFTTTENFKIKADRINRYLTSYDITAKDLRGFFANDLIKRKLDKLPEEELQYADEKKRQKLFNQIAKAVAEKVGHGTSTLKKHYLLPELENEFIKDGTVINLTEFYSGGEVKK